MSGDNPTVRDLWNLSKEINAKIDEKFDKFDKRLAHVEAWQWKASGVIAVFTTFVSVAVSYIWNRVIGSN